MEQLDQPAQEVLAQFIHEASKDPSSQTIAVTTLVMSLWQLGGQRMSHRVPSLVLVNATGLGSDPTDLLTSWLLAAPASSAAQTYMQGYFTGGTPKQAPIAMATAIKEKAKLGTVTTWNASIHQDLEGRYFDAQRTGFGHGPTRKYSAAWHETFSLITDRKGELILRLDDPEDRSNFCRDVLAESEKLRAPQGYGAGLQLVPKVTSVSGSIPAGMWDAEFAGAMVELGLPMLILPSVAKDTPEPDNPPVLELFAKLLPKAFDRPVEEPANFIPAPWFEVYGGELRTRLHHLPADYEYSIQKLARQIVPVCRRIATWCAMEAPPKEVEALWLELCMHTLRGLTLSIAGLAWHGLGFDTKIPRSKAQKVLQRLRDNGTMTMSDMLRGKAHLKKAERDILLDRFAAENLVRIDGKLVTAMTYPEFVAALYARENLPAPVNLTDEVAKPANPEE